MVHKVNPKSEDDKSFQCVVKVALNYGEIELHPERMPNNKTFIKQCNWKRINYP